MSVACFPLFLPSTRHKTQRHHVGILSFYNFWVSNGLGSAFLHSRADWPGIDLPVEGPRASHTCLMFVSLSYLGGLIEAFTNSSLPYRSPRKAASARRFGLLYFFSVALLWRCVPYTDSIHSGRNSVSVTVSALFIFRHAQGSRANMRSKLRVPSMNAGLRWAISGSIFPSSGKDTKRSHFLGKAKVRIFIPKPPHLSFFIAEEHIESAMFVTQGIFIILLQFIV